MKIEVGDRVTYENGFIEIILDSEEIGYQTVVKNNKVAKIERIGKNGWEVVEEKKELLTEEEREFLKLYIKYCLGYEYSNIYRIVFLNGSICIKTSRNCNHWGLLVERGFDNVENDKEYTLSELRIGGINNVNGMDFRRR